MNSSPDIAMWQAALEAGDLAGMREQLRAGMDPDALIPSLMITPLMLACSQGSVAVALGLLEAGANIDLAGTQTGVTPLMAAVHGARSEMVELLCRHGAQVNLLDQDGVSALGLAVSSQLPAIAQTLLARGADPMLCGGSTKAPLAQAAYNGDIPMVQRLLAVGARADTPGLGKRDSALIEAADGGHLELVRLLLDHNARIDQQDPNGNTPLILAVMTGHLAVVDLLLTRGANNNCTDKNGITALHRVFDLNNPDAEAIAMKLLPGFRTELANNRGETALFAAVAAGNHRIVQRLINMGANLAHTDKKSATVLHVAARHPDHTLTKLLLEHGAPAQAVDKKGRTALHMAAERGHLDMVKLLAGHCNINGITMYGSTPIMSAALMGEDVTALALMERKCALDVRNDMGGLQHCAATGGALNLLCALLAREAVDQSFNASGRTPLHEAAANNHHQVGAALVMAGADPELRTRDGLGIHDMALPAFMHAVGEAMAQRQSSLLQGTTTHATSPSGRRRI